MCGGLIGTLAMIPLRQFLICREHGKLPYPEGLACTKCSSHRTREGVRRVESFGDWGSAALKLLTDALQVAARLPA